MSPNLVAWAAVSVLTAGMQVALGTDLGFVVLSLLIFLLMPLVYGMLKTADSVGAYLLVATFAKLFILSQWLKVFYLQPADSNLEMPFETALVIFFGLAAFLAVAAALRVALPTVRLRLLPVSHDPDFMRALGIGIIGIVMVAMAVRYRVGLDRVGLEYGDDAALRGQGLVLWNHLAALLPLAAAVFTARSLVLTAGRRVVDAYVLVAIAACALAGLWENGRAIMFSGVVASYLTYLVYGGRVRFTHVMVGVVATVLMHSLIFPFIDIQRNLSRDLSASEYIGESANLAVELLTSERDSRFWDDSLQRMYETWSTRLYFGEPTGFFDRFTPSPVDEVVAHVAEAGTFGLDHAFYPLTRMVPYMVLRQFGLDHPEMGNALLEWSIWGRSTQLNYGILSEFYAYVGYPLYPIVVAAYMFVFLLALHCVYGGLRRNYFGAFAINQYMFLIADNEMGNLVSRMVEQGLIYVTLYVAARFVWVWLLGRQRVTA